MASALKYVGSNLVNKISTPKYFRSVPKDLLKIIKAGSPDAES